MVRQCKGLKNETKIEKLIKVSGIISYEESVTNGNHSVICIDQVNVDRNT
jgi:hypothetical protein